MQCFLIFIDAELGGSVCIRDSNKNEEENIGHNSVWNNITKLIIMFLLFFPPKRKIESKWNVVVDILLLKIEEENERESNGNVAKRWI